MLKIYLILTTSKIFKCKQIAKTCHAEQRISDGSGILGKRSPALLFFALLCFITSQQANRWFITPSPTATVYYYYYYYLMDLAMFTFSHEYTTICNVRGVFLFVWIKSYCNNCFRDLLRFAFVLFREARFCNSFRIVPLEIASLRDFCSLGSLGFLGLLKDSWDLNIRRSGNPVPWPPCCVPRAARSLYLFRSPGCETAFRNVLKSLLMHFCDLAVNLGPRHVWNFFLSIPESWARACKWLSGDL